MNEPLTYHRFLALFEPLTPPQKRVILELLDPPPSPSRAMTILMRRARKHFPRAFPSTLSPNERQLLIERTL